MAISDTEIVLSRRLIATQRAIRALGITLPKPEQIDAEARRITDKEAENYAARIIAGEVLLGRMVLRNGG